MSLPYTIPDAVWYDYCMFAFKVSITMSNYVQVYKLYRVKDSRSISVFTIGWQLGVSMINIVDALIGRQIQGLILTILNTLYFLIVFIQVFIYHKVAKYDTLETKQ
jgi:hypothetical protein